MFCLFILVALSAGLIFNVLSVALPKIMDERIAQNVPLVLVGSLATAVFLCGAVAQLTVGRLVERFPPHLLFLFIAALQLGSIWWAANASGLSLLVALALAMTAIYGQVTVNDVVIARYTADAWRGRVYAVRYFLTFVSSGVAVPAMAYLYTQGGFSLVLGTTAVIAVLFVIATTGIAILATSVERARATAPAE